MKNIVRKMKKTLNGLIIGLYTAGERISELENRPIKLPKLKHREKKSGRKKAEQHSRAVGQHQTS